MVRFVAISNLPSQYIANLPVTLPAELNLQDHWHLWRIRGIYPRSFFGIDQAIWFRGHRDMATRVEELQNKVRVKLVLAKKYENLSRISGSKPARAKFIRRSNQLRRQAAAFQQIADVSKS